MGCTNSASAPKKRKLMTYTNIRYSVTFNDVQLDYLSNANKTINRMMCLKTILQATSMENKIVPVGKYSVEVHVGQFVASKSQLGELWHCDPDTAEDIKNEFNQLGFITSSATNRTTIHTVHFLSVWFTGGSMIRNDYFRSNPTVQPIKKKVRKKKPKSVDTPAESVPTTTSIANADATAYNSSVDTHETTLDQKSFCGDDKNDSLPHLSSSQTNGGKSNDADTADDSDCSTGDNTLESGGDCKSEATALASAPQLQDGAYGNHP